MALWEQWRKEHNPEKPKAEKSTKLPIVYRCITDKETKALVMLNGCTFYPGSDTKRFVRQMQGVTKISEKQAGFLHNIFYRYRRQLHLSDEAARTWFDG